MLDNPVLHQVRKDIRDYGLIEPGFHVVAGVSGGADSVCLLKVLKELGQSITFLLQLFM